MGMSDRLQRGRGGEAARRVGEGNGTRGSPSRMKVLGNFLHCVVFMCNVSNYSYTKLNRLLKVSCSSLFGNSAVPGS